MFKAVKLVLAASAAATLVACGGGGGGGTPAAATSTLSLTQQNFEANAVKDTYSHFSWNLPTSNTAPISGAHYFFASVNSAPSSPTGGAVLNTGVTNNLTSTLIMPTMSQYGVARVLKSGVIYTMNATTKQTWSYVGGDVVLNYYATDGVTILENDQFDSISSPMPLTGVISSATILKQFLGFARINAPLNFDFTKSWIAGSNYFTAKGFFQSDLLQIYDYTGTTYDSNVSAYTGVETTIEGFFGRSSILTAGGWNVDSTLYNLSDGVISSIQGARVWVATNKRPTSIWATDNYLALIELNGKIYVGGVRKAGTRFKTIDGVDATIVNDYNIRLNSNATDSIKQTVRF